MPNRACCCVLLSKRKIKDSDDCVLSENYIYLQAQRPVQKGNSRTGFAFNEKYVTQIKENII
jgi:hypothetical protein